MFLRRGILAAAIVGLLPSAALAAPEERKGSPVEISDEGSLLHPKQLTESLRNARPSRIVAVHSVEQPKIVFDTQSFQPDTSGIGDVCFSSVGKFKDYQDRTAGDALPRAMTCESRDSIVKALGLASVFMKGTSYVCAFTPLPQAQIAAKVIDVTSYATSSIALVISVAKCENKMEEKFNALIRACEELNAMGGRCLGVDDEPF